MLNIKGVETSVWIRVITMGLAFVNLSASSIFGFQLLPFTDEEIYTGVSLVFTAGATIWVGWKNNSFTKEAQKADKELVKLKEDQ